MTENDILRKAVSILERRAKYNVKGDVFTSPDSVKRYLRIHFAALSDSAEHFTVLYLDNRHRLIESETPFHGTIDQAAVYPREILKRALHHSAAAVILSHNHPTGVAEPSQADITITKKIRESLALIDVRLLDHLVIGDNSTEVVSMAERGLF